jgi:hypothetical protein
MSETSAQIRRHASGRQTCGPGECVFNPLVEDASGGLNGIKAA